MLASFFYLLRILQLFCYCLSLDYLFSFISICDHFFAHFHAWAAWMALFHELLKFHNNFPCFLDGSIPSLANYFNYPFAYILSYWTTVLLFHLCAMIVNVFILYPLVQALSSETGVSLPLSCQPGKGSLSYKNTVHQQ